MMRQASEMMKTQAIDIEEQSQRGIVDIETLRITNQDLIDTIGGVLKAQAEGRGKRAAIEAGGVAIVADAPRLPNTAAIALPGVPAEKRSSSATSASPPWWWVPPTNSAPVSP